MFTCAGVSENFRLMVLQEMVTKYPLFVTDDLLFKMCHGNFKAINIKGCKNVTLKGLAVVLRRYNSTPIFNIS